MRDAVDSIFKLGLLIILSLALLILQSQTGAGRYTYQREGDLEFVFDTKTGVVYQGGYSMNHLTGEEGPRKK